ncbi:hypothetical protein V1517DRAFT_313950 [Lipomyces orientalis]|uniref:Uncharacterized protein n=1 Tax=Lipomyces orientalis TaxID=1233043 RepID=A0ACC3TWT1_9ASCO
MGPIRMPVTSIMIDQLYRTQLLQKHRPRLGPPILVIMAWTIAGLILHAIFLKIITGRVLKCATIMFCTRHPLPASLDMVLSKTMIADVHESELPHVDKLILQVAMHIASVWYCDHCLSRVEHQIIHFLRFREDTGLRWRRVGKPVAFMAAVALGVFGLRSLLRRSREFFFLWLALPRLAGTPLLSFGWHQTPLLLTGKLEVVGLLSYLESFVTPSTATSASSFFALMVLFLECNTHVLAIFVFTPLSNALAAAITATRNTFYALYCWSMPFIMNFRAEHGIYASESGWKISIQSSHGRVYSVDIRRRTDNLETPTSPSMNFKPSTSIFRRHKLRLLKENVGGAGIIPPLNYEKSATDQARVVSDRIQSYSNIVRESATRPYSTMRAENRHAYGTSINSGRSQFFAAIIQDGTTVSQSQTDDVCATNAPPYHCSVRNPKSASLSPSFARYIQSSMAPDKQSSSLPVIRWPRSTKSSLPFKSRSMSVSKFRYVSNPKFSLPESPIKKTRNISAISVNILSPKKAPHSTKVTRAIENCVIEARDINDRLVRLNRVMERVALHEPNANRAV